MAMSARRPLGGLIHSYQGYDPQRFPSPTRPPPDIAGSAMEHMLVHGSMRGLTDEQLAEAVEIDPSQIAGLGPSLDALIAMLEERKRRILETYDPKPSSRAAAEGFLDAARGVPGRDAKQTRELDDAVRARSIPGLERLWYRAERRDPELARALLELIDALGVQYELEALDADHAFTGREALDVPAALAVKEELETIDRLLDQLREALKNAKIAKVDLDALRRFVDDADVDQLRDFGRRIAEHIREQAELQGLERSEAGYRMTPRALRVFQGKLLREVFASLEASRSGRHRGPIVGEGAVELPKTRPYAFGDSAAHLDVAGTMVNVAVGKATKRRSDEATEGLPGSEPSVAPSLRHFVASPSDLSIHETRNTPKAATAVIMDMSGSMRYAGQYIACKKMALALDGLIRAEYPGDHLSLIEMYSFAKLRRVAEIPEIMPKPVTIRDPWVRLRVDMSDPDVSETMVHPHFTNIQRALQLARQVLSGQDTPNRQIFLITDGLPTAHYEGEHLYLLYPPDPLTERATMREAMLCAREGITLNTFLVPSWSQDADDIAFAHRLAETTNGRVFFTAGDDLDRFVLWDYVQGRRTIIG